MQQLGRRLFALRHQSRSTDDQAHTGVGTVQSRGIAVEPPRRDRNAYSRDEYPYNKAKLSLVSVIDDVHLFGTDSSWLDSRLTRTPGESQSRGQIRGTARLADKSKTDVAGPFVCEEGEWLHVWSGESQSAHPLVVLQCICHFVHLCELPFADFSNDFPSI